MLKKDNTLRCPKCGSLQLTSGTRGYNLLVGLIWGLLLFPVGFLFGLIGHKKTTVTCLKCGFKWYAGWR